MPLTHVVIDDKTYTIEEARELLAKRDNRNRYTPELFDAIMATRQERDYLSTTSLTAKCSRQQSIQRQVDYSEDLDGMWASFRGTMFHGQLEQHVQPGALEEARLFVTIDGIQLSGSPDLWDPLMGVLYDYKFCKEVPRWNKPWGDHIEQLNINRWLVDHAEKMVWRGRTYVPCEDDPRYFWDEENWNNGGAMDKVLVRPMDWVDLIVVYMDDKGVKPLRCTKSIQIPKVGGEGTKAAVVSDVWDDEQVEDLIFDRLPRVYDALTELNIPPAPEGWEHQSHILCSYCPVRKECAQFESEGV